MSEPSGAPAEPASALPPIVCLSHLGWDHNLFQRPQQIMSRLAERGHRVYYFACVGHRRHQQNPMKGPVSAAGNAVNVFTIPYAPGTRRFGRIRAWAAGLKIARVMAGHRVQKPIVWYYHPSLFCLAYSHPDAAIVYDVMDHFPSFEDTVDDIYFDELALLAEADVVFTGGRTLQRHVEQMLNVLVEREDGGVPQLPPAVPRCYPSGVDLEHFGAPATSLASGPARFMADFPSPRFGYFGAIDERMDWDIITTLANSTDGSVVLAGPVLKNPPPLPRNVHLPGPIAYQDLPALLQGFDVCLLPFKDSPLVHHISPTKTPEYLAGGRPVVSTPIPDVVTDYGDVVEIAATPADFAAACLRLIQQPPEPVHLAREAAARARTWDRIALEMDAIVHEAVESNHRRISRCSRKP